MAPAQIVPPPLLLTKPSFLDWSEMSRERGSWLGTTSFSMQEDLLEHYCWPADPSATSPRRPCAQFLQNSIFRFFRALPDCRRPVLASLARRGDRRFIAICADEPQNQFRQQADRRQDHSLVFPRRIWRRLFDRCL